MCMSLGVFFGGGEGVEFRKMELRNKSSSNNFSFFEHLNLLTHYELYKSLNFFGIVHI